MVKVSVIMSVYKEPIEWLRESVNSILTQTFTEFEFIIIIDNPDYHDALSFLQTLEKEDNRIKLLLNPENIGLTKSLNIGLRAAMGKYIARMDSDDISYPERFKKQFDFMEKNLDIVACGTGIRRFGKQEKTSLFQCNPEEISIKFTCPNPFLSPIAHPTAFIRNEVLHANNIMYNEDYNTAQDYGLWSELIFVGKISNLNEVLLDYRTSNQQITATKRKNQLLVVNNIINEHILRWSKKQNIDLSSPVILSQLLSLRTKSFERSQRRTLLAFEYGLLLQSRYSWIDSLRYFFTYKNEEISLREKARIVVKKFLGL